jgi:hypothetical protein
VQVRGGAHAAHRGLRAVPDRLRQQGVLGPVELPRIGHHGEQRQASTEAEQEGQQAGEEWHRERGVKATEFLSG